MTIIREERIGGQRLIETKPQWTQPSVLEAGE
jgi:hypothetical protein